ncbi:hypothetical protein F5Y13DRAFT_176288 [Hypoxylon sp. FL1857]|nr:hypothetical protein F5Y13DRAFT_176288 [Hypoxylon sp. FL1857]
MQQTKLPRLTTPTQGQPHPSSNLYRPQLNGHPQHLQPLPAAYGYLPQQMWSQAHHRLVSEGPHAVPLRMQRVTMNRTETRPMPIPSLQLSTDRPYSVPTYLNYRTGSESGGSILHPPRPASSSEVDRINRLVPSRPVLSPQHRTTQEVENDPFSFHSTATSVEAIRPIKVPKITRAVAKRGPKTSTNSSSREGSHAGLSLALFSPEQSSSKVVGGQKRATELTATKYFPSKRININVTLTESQALITPIAPKAYSPMDPHIPNIQVEEDHDAKDNILEKESSETLDDNTTQSSDSDGEVIEAMLTSENSVQAESATAVKSGQHDITNKFSSAEGLQKAKGTDKSAVVVANLKNTNVVNVNPKCSDVVPETPNGKSQNHIVTRRQYANSWAQCDIDLEAVPNATQIEPEGRAPEDHHTVVGGITTVQDTAQRKVNDETLASRLLRVEQAVAIQKEKGMDEFVKERLNSGDPNVLQTLTNEILLGLVVHDNELLEQIVKTMQVC